MDFSIAGVEITQGIQYYRSKDHLDNPADQLADNSIPLVANKRTWVRVYLEGSSALSVTGTATVSRKIGAYGVWSTSTVNAKGPCTPVAPGSKYEDVRGHLSSSLNFELSPELVAGEIRIDIVATDGVHKHSTTVNTAAPVRQTLKIAAIMVEGDINGTKIAAPTRATAVNTTWKAPRALPVSEDVEFRIATRVTLKLKQKMLWYTDDKKVEHNDGSWELLRQTLLKAKQDDGAQPGWIYYGFVPHNLIDPKGTWGVDWGSEIAGGRVWIPGDSKAEYDTFIHEVGHGLGLKHVDYGQAPDPDLSYPEYKPYFDAVGVGSIGEWGLDVVDGTIVDPAHSKDFMGYESLSPERDHFQWISPFSFRKIYKHPNLNPLPAESPSEIWRDRWSTGWTNMVPFELNGKPHVLTYKYANPAVKPDAKCRVDIDLINDDAEGTTTIFSDSWTPGWSHIVPFVLKGHPHLLSYKAGIGTVNFDRINDDGRGTTTLAPTKWASDWTTIVSFQLGGKPHLFSYKASDGVFHIDRINDDGKGTTNVFQGSWTRDWTIIVPFEFNGKPHLLSYKQYDPLKQKDFQCPMDIDRINDDGKGTTNVHKGSWSPGWTHITAFQFLGKPHVFSYKAGLGTVALDRIRDDGQGTTTLYTGNWTKDWTTITSLQLGGRAFLLEYKAGDGIIAIDRVNG